MSKFNKNNFPLLFATVSKVLGEEDAERQLSIAYESSGGKGWEDYHSLAAAFGWGSTEQGDTYWENIYYQGGNTFHE